MLRNEVDSSVTPKLSAANAGSTLGAEVVNPKPALAAGVGADHFKARRFSGFYEIGGEFDPKHAAAVLRVRLRHGVAHARAAVGALPNFVGERDVEIEQRRAIQLEGEFARRLRKKSHGRGKTKVNHSPAGCATFLPLPL